MRVGLFGLGHLGKIHLRCLEETPFQLVGIYDPILDVEAYEGHRVYNSQASLIDAVDACLVIASTDQHYAIASQVLKAGKHCFVEKPLASSIDQAQALTVAAQEQPDLITQVGFVERYNPAYQFVANEINKPRFLEVHRLAQFNERGNEVSVVSDLMIHDLDLILSMMDSPIKEVKATGVNVLTDNMDICNARIEFEDGSVANVTASRMSMKNMRKFRIFQSDAYLSMDLAKRESQIIRIGQEPAKHSMPLKVGDVEKHITLKSSGELKGNAIVQEQRDFYQSIKNGVPSQSDFKSALNSSVLADRIERIAEASMSEI
jgi:predicted dehydrogenase